MPGKTPARVAAEKKVAVEQAKVNAQKNAANKAKVDANRAKVEANRAAVNKATSPKPKTTTSKPVTVTATRPRTYTSKEVTVTAKKPSAVDQSGAIYLVKNNASEKARQVSFSEYNKHKGPKDKMQRDASGYILEKGSGGKRTSVDYTPSKNWKKW